MQLISSGPWYGKEGQESQVIGQREFRYELSKPSVVLCFRLNLLLGIEDASLGLAARV
jgi:hypothetical protein